MRQAHYQRYLAERYVLDVDKTDGDAVITGRLVPRMAGISEVPIVRGIPRFVSDGTYANSFGFQWHRFRSTQLDSRSGLPLSATRFWTYTRWEPVALRGRTVLEVGSGAGRFTEVLLAAGASVVSFDLSTAVDANDENNAGKGDLFLVQADCNDLPFSDGVFDYVFCYGVLQHTPDPTAAYRAIFRKLKPGGKISIDYYVKTDGVDVWSTPKYAWRRWTTRMRPETLLRILRWYIPFWFPVDTCIKRIPRVGHWVAAHLRIPCWNYYGSGLTYRQCVEWAILDTFDALSAAHDQPKTLDEVRAMIALPENASEETSYGSNGIVANVTRRATSNA